MPSPLEIFIYTAVWVFVENLYSGIWRLTSTEFTIEQKKQGLTWSYLYMIPMYAVLSTSFKLLTTLYAQFFWVWIVLISYTIGVVLGTLVESLFGLIYDKIFPKFCPWGKYTKEQRGITWLGGYSRWDISLIFGVLMLAFHGFTIILGWSLK